MMDVDGDTFLWNEIERLVKSNDIQVIVETGTYLGNTAKKFATIADVITCEVNDGYYDSAVKNIGDIKNIVALHGSSAAVLRTANLLFKDKRVLFFLDAHWYAYCPLLDELRLIAELGMKPIIVIHDFKVPGKDFGHDSYQGRAFEYSMIEAEVEEIYGKEGFKYYYNEQSDGPKRGAIFIMSKEHVG